MNVPISILVRGVKTYFCYYEKWKQKQRVPRVEGSAQGIPSLIPAPVVVPFSSSLCGFNPVFPVTVKNMHVHSAEDSKQKRTMAQLHPKLFIR